MTIPVEKIPGGFSVDGLELKNGKCGCTSVLPCCYSWSKIRRSGNTFTYIGKTSAPDTADNFTWSYAVRKGDITVEVTMEDARDKALFSGYYPPRIEEWIERGWEVIKKDGDREDFALWRCSACRRLYKEQEQTVPFDDLPRDWQCPVCKTSRDVFEKVG
jgi:rubredoxin